MLLRLLITLFKRVLRILFIVSGKSKNIASGSSKNFGSGILRTLLQVFAKTLFQAFLRTLLPRVLKAFFQGVERTFIQIKNQKIVTRTFKSLYYVHVSLTTVCKWNPFLLTSIILHFSFIVTFSAVLLTLHKIMAIRLCSHSN